MSGRRRQGKTFLLRALCQATGGFYFAADEATDRESLNRLGSLLAEHLDAPAPFRFETWHSAIDALLALGGNAPLLAASGWLGAERAKLACFAGAGFSEELRRAAAQDDEIVLVSLADVYGRD